MKKFNAYFQRGLKYAMNKDYESSISDFEKAIKINNQDSDVYYNLALSKLHIGSVNEAKSDFMKAIDLDPSVAFYYANLAQALLADDDAQNAIFYLTKAITIDPKRCEYYYERSQIFSATGDFDKAIDDINEAIKLDPKQALWYQGRCRIYDNYNYKDEALKDINKAIKLEPDNAIFYSSRGIIRGGKGEFEKAAQDYTKAIQLDPSDIISYTNLASVYINLGSYRAAIDNCNKAISVNPESAIPYSFRAGAKQNLGDRENAKSDFRKSVALQLQSCMRCSDKTITLCVYRPINEHTIELLKENFIWFSHPDNFNDPFDTKFYKDITREKVILDILKDIRIRSFSRYEETCNTVLWGYYADNHKGILIEYEFDLQLLKELNISLSKVRYSDFIKPENKILWADEYAKSFVTKAKAWEHENEWRMITLKENLSDGNKLKKGFKIKSITFGFNTAEKYISLVKKLVPKCHYYKMVQEDKFKKPFAISHVSLNNYENYKDLFSLDFYEPQSLKEQLEDEKK
ncbi:MAG: tetratricopeptide repeat protein [Heliobacteriaceae bacterium]|jgi:Flp pilus assembly protein TadD|nr:tetratricopeptide repeat protein [Heliobacteriaceae bacterium]